MQCCAYALGSMYIYQINKYQYSANESTVFAQLCLVAFTVFLLLLGNFALFLAKKTINVHYKSIREYDEFLNGYCETPRSKLVKKYRPSLEPLQEASLR